ncbi:MAG: portal protein, partial [Culicoidibacterales bacterium]
MDKKVSQAQNLYKTDSKVWSPIYEKAREDLCFLSDEDGAMWNARDYQRRLKSGRPIVSVDQLSQFIQQTANDIRMNTPSINILPSDGGDIETAEIYKGLIRNIEYQSNADNAYDFASESAIKCSIGFIRVDTEYENANGADQRLVIKRVVDPLSVYIDASSVEVDGSDAKHAFIIERLTVKQFKARYPNFAPVSFADKDVPYENDDDMISITEYFKADDEYVRKGYNDDGEELDYEDGVEYKNVRDIQNRR